MSMASPRQRSARHGNGVGREKRRLLLVARDARDATDADAQQLDIVGLAVELELEADRPGDGHHEALAGAVRGEKREALVGDAANVHDEGRAVAAEGGQQLAHQVHGEEGVEAHVAGDAGLGGAAERAVDGVAGPVAGVVDEDGEVEVGDGGLEDGEVEGAAGELAVLVVQRGG